MSKFKINFPLLLLFFYRILSPHTAQAQSSIPIIPCIAPDLWYIRSAHLPDISPPKISTPFILKQGATIPVAIFPNIPQKLIALGSFGPLNRIRENGEITLYPSYVFYCTQDVTDETGNYTLLPRGCRIRALYRLDATRATLLKVQWVGIEINYPYTVFSEPQLIAISQYREGFKKSHIMEKVKQNPEKFVAQDAEEKYIYEYYYKRQWLDTIFDDPPMTACLTLSGASMDNFLKNVNVHDKDGRFSVDFEPVFTLDFTLKHDLLFAAVVEVGYLEKKIQRLEYIIERSRRVFEDSDKIRKSEDNENT